MTGSYFLIYTLLLLAVFVILFAIFGRYLSLDRLKQRTFFSKHWSRDRTNYTLIVLIIIFVFFSNYYLDVPLKLLFLLTLLNLIIKENYPFSNYPMYSTFDQNAFFVYVTDERDNVIPMSKAFKVKSSFMKKIFMNEVEKRSSKNPVDYFALADSELKEPGLLTLNYLLEYNNNPEIINNINSIKLYFTTIYLDGAEFKKKNRLANEIKLK